MAKAAPELKTFLEGLQPFNTVGKLKNFPHDTATIASQQERLDLVKAVEDLVELVQQIDPVTCLSRHGRGRLAGRPCLAGCVKRHRRGLGQGREPQAPRRSELPARARAAPRRAESKYQDAYLELHGRARLGANADKQKGQLRRTLVLRSCRSSRASR